MPLIDCPDIYGNTTLFAQPPECRTHENVLYMPIRNQAPREGRSYGLFRADGSLIHTAGRFRGPDGEPAGPQLWSRQDRAAAAFCPDDSPFFYMGTFTNHYGHFLVDTLCRLWALAAHGQPHCKILYHAIEAPPAFFEQKFSRTLFEVLGIAESRLVKFDEPTVLRRVIIPAPSFEELNYAHRAFAEFLNRLGALIGVAAAPARGDTPVYLTKMHVKSGISHFVNEDLFANRLAKAGVEIIAPERLALKEQIEIFAARRPISGLIGSAFHTAAFAPGRDMLVLNYGRTVWSNQILIDQANNGKSRFVCAETESENLGANERFGNNFVMADPVGLAEDFLRRLEACQTGPALPHAKPEGGMKWYFALSAASIDNPGHDWRSLIRVAVLSSLQNTTLRPHLIWAGPEHPFLAEMRERGVTVIFHEIPFYHQLAAYKSDPAYLATAAGCFLRIEIPLIEQTDEFVLYTDADVIFLADPVPYLRTLKPRHFAAAPEFTPTDDLNSGVLLLNVRQMRQDYPAFVSFVRAHPQLGFDQEMYRRFYAGRYENLDPDCNWKPYWGVGPGAKLLHWHGVKPVEARRYVADPACSIAPDLAVLIQRDHQGYGFYLNVFQRYLECYGAMFFHRNAVETHCGSFLVYDFVTGVLKHKNIDELGCFDFLVWCRFGESPCLFAADDFGNERRVEWIGGQPAHGFAANRRPGDARSLHLQSGANFVTALPGGSIAADRTIADQWEIVSISDGYAPFIKAIAASLQPPARPSARVPAAGNCAVVLVVKDEASDIAAWLAWYDLLGFDCCIVFDDNSTDATWEILEKAVLVQNIRLHRTKGPAPGPYERRQEESYRFALTEYGPDFAWLAFFDADEYLLLNRDDDIKSFLNRFKNADAVAVNWCNYGSGGHLLKPSAPPTEAYTWHGDERETINRHVKSFVRPDKVGQNWLNVHCFDVAPELYRLSNGQPVRWSQTGGIIDSDPDWSVAKLMHYQCRSMEHFIERLKKRPELAAIPGIWHAYDFRSVQDTSPRALAPRLNAQIAAITQTQDRAAAGEIDKKLIFDIGMSEGNDSAFYLAKGFRVVGVEADAKIYLSLCERFAEEIKTGAMTIHNAAAGETAGQIVEFFHHDEYQGLSGLRNTRPEFGPGTYKTYHVLTIDWPYLIAKHGVPYYAKIDIEGQEAAFLRAAAGNTALPDYISVECHALEPVEMLHRLGYNLFKLVDQNPPGGFVLPSSQLEGNHIAWTDWSHTSGPFGRDLAGDWVPFETFKKSWLDAQPDYARTWFDCHAWRP